MAAAKWLGVELALVYKLTRSGSNSEEIFKELIQAGYRWRSQRTIQQAMKRFYKQMAESKTPEQSSKTLLFRLTAQPNNWYSLQRWKPIYGDDGYYVEWLLTEKEILELKKTLGV